MAGGPHIREHGRLGRRGVASLGAFLVANAFLLDGTSGAQADPATDATLTAPEQSSSLGLAEILWTIGAFAVLVFFVWRIGLPAMRKAVENRRSRLASQVVDAEAAGQEAEALNAEYTRRLADATSEADRVIAEGREQAARIRREMELEAEQKRELLRDRAIAEIEATRIQAIADVRAETAELANAIADHLTRRSGDATMPRRIAPMDPRGPRAT